MPAETWTETPYANIPSRPDGHSRKEHLHLRLVLELSYELHLSPIYVARIQFTGGPGEKDSCGT